MGGVPAGQPAHAAVRVAKGSRDHAKQGFSDSPAIGYQKPFFKQGFASRILRGENVGKRAVAISELEPFD
jgi:hypothetical protein